MKGIKVGVVIVLVLIAGTAVEQSVPQLINYQGRLTDSSGQPLDGETVDLSFSFYGVVSGGTAYLSVLQEDVLVTKGIYHVLIGSGTITPGTESTLADVFQKHKDVWMGVKVNTDLEMTPRSRITSVPYAMAFDLNFLYSTKDFDSDGHDSPLFGGDDCNDADPTIHPGATEVPGDSIDQSCDGYPFGPVDVCARLIACGLWEDGDCVEEISGEIFAYYDDYAPIRQLVDCAEGATCGDIESVCMQNFGTSVENDLCDTLDSCGYMTAADCHNQLDSAEIDFDWPLEQTLCLLDAGTCDTNVINQCLASEYFRFWRDRHEDVSGISETYSIEAGVTILFSNSTENIDLRNPSGVVYDLNYGLYGDDWEWYYRWDYAVTGGASFAELVAAWPAGEYTVLRGGSTIDTFSQSSYSISLFAKDFINVSPSYDSTVDQDPLPVYWQIGPSGQDPEFLNVWLNNQTRGGFSEIDELPGSATSASVPIPAGTQNGDTLSLTLQSASPEELFKEPLSKYFDREFQTFHHEGNLNWGGP
jgi:hypothetical protein